jgi:hypothetical protein
MAFRQEGKPKIAERYMAKERTKPIRISVDLPPRAFQRLERLERVVSAASKAEVMREALRIYEYLVELALDGADFQVVEKGANRHDAKTVILFTNLEEDSPSQHTQGPDAPLV